MGFGYPQKFHVQEEIPDPQMTAILTESEIRSLGAENEIQYIYRKNDIYMIRIQKSTNYIEYVFSNCLIQDYYMSTDGQKAAVKFTYSMQEQIVVFNTSDLSTGKVFRQLIANGYPIVFKMTSDIRYCFESYISQRLLKARKYPVITKGFNKIFNNNWRFCYKDNHKKISPFTHGNWNNAALQMSPGINLQASYNVIKCYLCSLTKDIYAQSFLFFLFAYLPVCPFLKAYKYELDKTIHLIGNMNISENIINNFLKVFNKGEEIKYHLSLTPSGTKEALNEVVYDIQPFYFLDSYNEWNKYQLQNYDTLIAINSGFNKNKFLSIPVLVNLPLFYTNLNRAIIIDTSNFINSDINYNMIPYFNYFILKWTEFIEKNQKEFLGSIITPFKTTENLEAIQTAKCIYKVMGLLQSFLNINLSINEELLKNCMSFLHKQEEYEHNCGLESHIKKTFREFFQDESRYKAYDENALINKEDLDNQIFYSDGYIAISSDTLSLIINPLIDCGVHKKEIMEELIIQKLLHKPKESSYCSTAYLTNLSGKVQKKTVVQFRRKILDWLKLDISI